MSPGYEAFFGLHERPFSLTPDPKYFFESRSHGSAVQTISAALDRREQFVLLTGDHGVGKTLFGRTLLGQLRTTVPVSFIANPLLTPSGLNRLLLEDLGAFTAPDARRDTRPDPREGLLDLLSRANQSFHRAVIVIDEAQSLPATVIEQLQALAGAGRQRGLLVQLVLIGQPVLGEPGAQGLRALDPRITTKTRLMPLTRDECASYVAYRLSIASAAPTLVFSPSAIEILHGLSGGVPRLINLVAERSLQEAALHGTHKVGPSVIDAAAAALELLQGAPRRFRWFTRRVS